jgi:hypothetical protein
MMHFHVKHPLSSRQSDRISGSELISGHIHNPRPDQLSLTVPGVSL